MRHQNTPWRKAERDSRSATPLTTSCRITAIPHVLPSRWDSPGKMCWLIDCPKLDSYLTGHGAPWNRCATPQGPAELWWIQKYYKQTTRVVTGLLVLSPTRLFQLWPHPTLLMGGRQQKQDLTNKLKVDKRTHLSKPPPLLNAIVVLSLLTITENGKM